MLHTDRFVIGMLKVAAAVDPGNWEVFRHRDMMPVVSSDPSHSRVGTADPLDGVPTMEQLGGQHAGASLDNAASKMWFPHMKMMGLSGKIGLGAGLLSGLMAPKGHKIETGLNTGLDVTNTGIGASLGGQGSLLAMSELAERAPSLIGKIPGKFRQPAAVATYLAGMLGGGYAGHAYAQPTKSASVFQDTLLKSPTTLANDAVAGGVGQGLMGAGIGGLAGAGIGALAGHKHRGRHAIIGGLLGALGGGGVGAYTGADSALKAGLNENAGILDRTADNMNLMGVPIAPVRAAGLRRDAADMRESSLLKVLLSR